MNERNSTFLLFLVAIVWGASYVLTKVCLEYTSTYQLIFYRFFIAFIITLIFLRKNILPIKKHEIFYSAFLSIILLLVFITMTIGLKYTTASNAGFIISLSIVFIPIFSYFISRETITIKNIILILFSVAGIYLISFQQEALSIRYGDLLCLICAILFALHVSLAGKFTRECNSITLGVLQFGFTSFYSLFFLKFDDYKSFSLNKYFLISLLLLSIFCTALGYIFQLIAQKKANGVTTAIILSLEPVFSAIFAYFTLSETMTFQQLLGASILFLSVLALEFNPKTLIKKYTI